MTVFDLLIGKTVKVRADVGIDVNLKISDIKNTSWTRQITPDTPQNDWWGERENVTRYTVTFDTGFKKEYDKLESIQII